MVHLASHEDRLVIDTDKRLDRGTAALGSEKGERLHVLAQRVPGPGNPGNQRYGPLAPQPVYPHLKQPFFLS